MELDVSNAGVRYETAITMLKQRCEKTVSTYTDNAIATQKHNVEAGMREYHSIDLYRQQLTIPVKITRFFGCKRRSRTQLNFCSRRVTNEGSINFGINYQYEHTYVVRNDKARFAS